MCVCVPAANVCVCVPAAKVNLLPFSPLLPPRERDTGESETQTIPAQDAPAEEAMEQGGKEDAEGEEKGEGSSWKALCLCLTPHS